MAKFYRTGLIYCKRERKYIYIYCKRERKYIYYRWAYIRHYNLNLLVRVKTSKVARYLLWGFKQLDKRPLSFSIGGFSDSIHLMIKKPYIGTTEGRVKKVSCAGYAIVFFQEWNFSNSFNCILLKLSVQCINKSTIFSRAILFCIIGIPSMWTNILYWVLPLILSV